MPIDEKNATKSIPKGKIYTALVTQKVLCNKKFSLVEGEEIPRGIDAPFIQSLLSSNLIK